MILLTAVIAGIFAGLARAYWGRRQLQPLDLRLDWLVIVAFLPQLLAFQIPVTSALFSDNWARAALVSSQALLIVFAWLNRKQAGFWALGTGLLLNFVVIVLNGGLMPISPQLVERYIPYTSGGLWEVGERLGTGKDIILPIGSTTFWWLSDRFTLPEWIPYRVAYSIGDLFIGTGAFWLFWSLGGPQEKPKEEQQP